MSKVEVAQQEASRISQRAGDAWHRAEEELRARPWRTVALAAGAGYVIGGGLFSPFTARLLGFGLRVGLRAGAVPLVASRLGSLVEDAFSRNDSEEAHPPEAPTESPEGRRGQSNKQRRATS